MFALLMPLMMLIMNFTTIAILWFGTKRIDVGSSNVGNMMAFLQYAMQILFSFLMASIMFIMIPRAQASAERINEVLELESEVVDPPAPEAARGPPRVRRVQERQLPVPRSRGAGGAGHLLRGPARGDDGIIGSTGSGKSTLLSLIPRFYDVTAGAVLVDGLDVRQMTQSELRSRIGFVPQKATLFTGSVAENIRYGKKDASDVEVRRAAETAQALEFVSAMEQGFDSMISQGGTNVSGGQKQRLSIARALVKHAGIYLFDDSFSALDFKTDSRLRAALRQETADATVIIVGQRVATIMDADRIIVLDEGRIAGWARTKSCTPSARCIGRSWPRSSRKKRSHERRESRRPQNGRRHSSGGIRRTGADGHGHGPGARREAQGHGKDRQAAPLLFRVTEEEDRDRHVPRRR